MITVRFACGHDRVSVDDKADAVCCPQCGETRVQAVKVRAPRFSGFVAGPCAEFKDLSPARVQVGAKE